MGEMADWRSLHGEISRWLDELRLSNAPDNEIIRAIEDRIKLETNGTAIYFLKSNLAREHTKQGNEAAADELYSELLPEVEYWYRNLYRTNRTAHDKTVKAIEE